MNKIIHISRLVFSAKTGGSEEWKAVISAISTLVEEATFEATGEGIAFRGMDVSHVALIDIAWPNSAFEKFVCDADIKFGVRIDEFSKIIKRADKKDNVEISISEDKLLLVTIGKNKKYKMRLIESSAIDTPLPKITYNAKVGVTSAEFDKILGDIQVVSEYLSINVNPTKAEFSGRGDSGEAIITLEKGMPEMQEIEVKEDSNATYGLDYINNIVKAIGTVAGTVVCEYSSKMPLRLEFKVANIGRIHYYLAPRVES